MKNMVHDDIRKSLESLDSNCLLPDVDLEPHRRLAVPQLKTVQRLVGCLAKFRPAPYDGRTNEA